MLKIYKKYIYFFFFFSFVFNSKYETTRTIGTDKHWKKRLQTCFRYFFVILLTQVLFILILNYFLNKNDLELIFKSSKPAVFWNKSHSPTTKDKKSNLNLLYFKNSYKNIVYVNKCACLFMYVVNYVMFNYMLRIIIVQKNIEFNK